MSDILLSVGMQKGNVGSSQLEIDIKEVVARISKNPPKVSVGLTVDQTALNNFKSQLTQIVNSVGLSKGAPITVNISGIGEITAQAGKAKQALDGVAKAGKQAADAVGKMNAKETTDSLTKVNKLLMQMQANYAKWTAAQSGKSSTSYSAYGKQIDELIILKGQVEANAISAEKFAERLSAIRAAATNAASAIKSVGEDHTVATIKKLTQGSEEYNKAIGQAESLLAQVKKRQEEWTAAKNGKSSEAYKNLSSYSAELEELISKLRDGKMDAATFAKEFDAIQSKVKASEGTIKSAGENTKTLGDRLKGLAEKFGAWLSVSQVIMQAVRAIKQMVSAVRDVDAAMTELKKVTSETDAVYTKFLENASVRAKQIGASISDVVNATADFARLGHGIEDASNLADIAIIYKNIGDGIEDVATASESIISTMQAFGIEAVDAISIVDKFNEVGNNFAISSAGIGDAMQRSAAAMAAANNTIDETIALITAANTIVQNPDSVGTTMKTISMYLRAAKTEAEEAGESTEGMANSVSELRQEILDLTGQRVDIQLDEDTFKSTYQILKELSEIWDSLTDVTQANVLEMIGGKRNANVVSALLENFSIAEESLKTSMEAAGSAMAENEKHLDSINGKIGIFKATFEELSVNLINSDFVKGVVDFGTALLEILGAVAKLIDALGGLNSVLYITISYFAISNAAAIGKFFVNIFNNIKRFGKDVAGIGPVFKELKSAGTGSLDAISQAFSTLGISMSKFQIIATAVVGIIGLATLAYNKIKQAQEEARQEAISSAEAASELTAEISDLTMQYITLSEAVKTDESAKESLISTQKSLIERLGLEQYEVAKLTEEYGSLSDAILHASKQELQAAEIDLSKGIKARRDELMDAISWIQRDNREYDSAYIDMLGIGYYSDGSLFPTDDDYAKMEKAHADALAAFEALQSAGLLGADSMQNGAGDFVLDFGFDVDSVDGIIATHDKLREMLILVDDVAGSDNQIYEHLEGLYENIADAVADYNDSVGALNNNLAQQYVIQGLIGQKVPATQADFDTYRQSVIDAAVASGEFIGGAEEIGSAIDGILKQDSSFAKFYTNTLEDAFSDLGDESDTVVDKLGAIKARLLEMVAAYSKWKSVQSGPESGDIYDDSITALQQIIDGLESGKVGTDKYKASVEFLVPEANREDVAAYVESLKRYIAEDASGVSNFISDAITAGLMVDDGSGNISIVSDATVKDFCDKLKITPDMAQAIFGELEEYGWNFEWSAEDFTDAESESGIQTVKEGVDGISDSVDSLNAKVIGDLGAAETVVSLIEVIKWMDEIDSQSISDKHYDVYAHTHTVTEDGGQSSANGTNSADGGRTLVGEFGTELVVSDDRYYLVGQNGAEFVNLKHGDMVFNHVDTQKILKGKSGVRGQALWAGSFMPHAVAFDDGGNIIVEVEVKSDAVKVGGGGSQILPIVPSNGSGNGNTGSGTGGQSDEESWFEKQLKEHQHLVEMDKESQEEYLDWLDDAYKRAYEEGIIDLDDFYKYEEEIYQGRQDLFKDHLNDIEHEISILEAGVGNSDEIINLSLQAIQDIEDELAAARAAGLDENGDYIQWLEQQWMNYNETVTELREDAEANSKNTIDDLVEYRIDMLKQEIQDQKDALNEQLDDLRDFYDKQRKMLQDQYDEEKYLEEQNEKRKSVTDIRSDLAMLENDDSAWAQKRKLELQAELADAEKELSNFERDHALDMTLDMLDEQQAAQEAQIQAQMDALDEKLNDPHALFNQALEDIKNNTAELYQAFIDYNRKHGTGNDQDIADMWEEAYIADLEYQDTHNGEHKDGIEIGNYTGYVAPDNPTPPAPTAPASGAQDNTPTEPEEPAAPQLTDEIKRKVAAAIWNGGYGWGTGSTRTNRLTEVFGAGNGIQDLVNSGVGKSGISLSSEYTYANMRKKFKGYASGTKHATPGLHEVDEYGSEYLFVSPSDGTRYRMFTGGEKVLNADATNFLYDFANSGGAILTKMLSDLFGIGNFGNIAKPTQVVHISSGDINIHGNADTRTVSEIRRAQRDNVEFIIKEFNKLNR